MNWLKHIFRSPLRPARRTDKSPAELAAEHAAAVAARDVWNKDYDRIFVKSGETLSEEQLKAVHIGRDINFAVMFLVAKHRSYHEAENVLREAATNAADLPFQNVRAYAYWTLGDFLFMVHGDPAEAKIWISRAADDMRGPHDSREQKDVKLEKKILRSLAQVQRHLD